VSDEWRKFKILLATLFIASAVAACSNTSWVPVKGSQMATLEDIPGSNLKRLVLTGTAAKRLAIETDTIRMEKVRRWLVVNGEVEAVALAASPAAPSHPPGDRNEVASASIIPVRVRVPTQSQPEALGGTAIAVVSLGDGENDGDDSDDEIDDADDPDDSSDQGEEEISAVIVLPIGSQYGKVRFRARQLEAGQGSSDGMYFAVDNAEPGLRPGQRVVVRTPQPGSGNLHKVVSYSAIIYDLQGNTWIYVNPEPLVFIRHAVGVEHVDRDLAILTDGPPVGTSVVTVGAAELMGIEQKIGH
jgi:hypothetical protein